MTTRALMIRLTCLVLVGLAASVQAQVHYHDNDSPWGQRAESGPDAEVPGWFYNLGVTLDELDLVDPSWVLRVGERVSLRELVGGETAPRAWTKAAGEKGDLRIDDDADVVTLCRQLAEAVAERRVACRQQHAARIAGAGLLHQETEVVLGWLGHRRKV